MEELKDCFGDGCVDFTDDQSEAFFENIAMCEETALDEFLVENRVSEEKICAMIGAAEGISVFLWFRLEVRGRAGVFGWHKKIRVCAGVPGGLWRARF